MKAIRGTTLVEMLVVLMLMSIVAGVATLALRLVERTRLSAPITLLRDSSSAAVRDGRVITLSTMIDGRRATATLRPDGGVVADSAFHAPALTGRSIHAPR